VSAISVSTTMFGLMVHNGTKRNEIKWNGTERDGMEHKLYSIVWTFYGEVVFQPTHPKLEGQKNQRKWWNEMESIPPNTTPFHLFLKNPSNGTSFHTTITHSTPSHSINPNKAYGLSLAASDVSVSTGCRQQCRILLSLGHKPYYLLFETNPNSVPQYRLDVGNTELKHK
jgi:hypothetical protein